MTSISKKQKSRRWYGARSWSLTVWSTQSSSPPSACGQTMRSSVRSLMTPLSTPTRWRADESSNPIFPLSFFLQSSWRHAKSSTSAEIPRTRPSRTITTVCWSPAIVTPETFIFSNNFLKKVFIFSDLTGNTFSAVGPVEITQTSSFSGTKIWRWIRWGSSKIFPPSFIILCLRNKKQHWPTM